MTWLEGQSTKRKQPSHKKGLNKKLERVWDLDVANFQSRQEEALWW